MKIVKNDRGFEFLNHRAYRNPMSERLASQSSAIFEYPDAADRPGTSALWIGDNHHLNREQVAELVAHLQAWLATGSLELPASA